MFIQQNKKVTALFFLFLFFLSSCSYDKTDFEIGSLFDPTWDFSIAANLDFEENFVEVKNGKTQLKIIDLDDRGAEFELGTFDGSLMSLGSLTIDGLKTSTAKDLKSILPDRVNAMEGYWKFENNWLDSSAEQNHGTPDGDAAFSSSEFISGVAAGSFDGTKELALEYLLTGLWWGHPLS